MEGFVQHKSAEQGAAQRFLMMGLLCPHGALGPDLYLQLPTL